ncbi:MFS transporter [Limnoglobus roseus]|uniref:MFS transporter n=1 Tax=Limnoglobus roseus TaxID=2598579 RepID=A0A5C1AGM4_9BACT|nr:MFS transporter [Limnoglobus roseus]QEL17980.1 MFS transporter [Limnoglobus roseus]
MQIDSPAAAPAGLKFKLAVMMFFQFFIWGAWFELGFDYIPKLGFNGDWQLPLIFGAFNIGALVALFFSAQFADRKFAAEKFLAISHLIGGLAIGGLFFIRPDPTDKAAVDAAFWPFFGLMLLHSVFYVPTISITNSIAFANLRNPSQEFGPVRVWGTIGWIAASWPFIFLLADWARVPAMGEVGFVGWIGKVFGTSLEGPAALGMKSYVFALSGVASLLLAAFSLTLPHTPPKPATGEDSLAWLKAMKLLKHPFVLILFLVTFIDAAVHQSFFFWSFTFLGPKSDGGVVDIPANWVGAVMKIGQIAEILTMLVLGYVLKNLGWRTTMIIGVLGHGARFAVFAFMPEQMPCILINIVHGICYAFFFATVYIFVDEYFPKDVRSSAQGLFNVLILGVGPFVANFICGRLKVANTTPSGGVDYPAVFQVSMIASLVGAVLLLLFFHPPKKETIGS